MSVNDKSINGTVKDIISNDISFQDSLHRGYCNISALAKILNKKVNTESIVTALKRSRKIYEIHERRRISLILAGSVISVKTDVAKLSTSKSKNTIEIIAKALKRNADNFLSISESILSITLVFDN